MVRNTDPQQDPLFDGDAFVAPRYETGTDEPHFAGKPTIEKSGVATSVPVEPAKLTTEGIAREVRQLEEEIDRAANLSGSTYAIAYGKEVGARPKRAPAPGNRASAQRPRGTDIPVQRLGPNLKMTRDRNSVPEHERIDSQPPVVRAPRKPE